MDKLKQSGAPGEDLSKFIPTPTWGSPRVAELQPAALGAGGNKPAGLAAKAAHAASLLAQAAANSAARSNSMAAAAAAAAAAAPGGDAAAAQDAQMQADDAGTAAVGGNSPSWEGRKSPPDRAVQETAAGAAGAARGSDVPDSMQPAQQLERHTSGQLMTSLLRQQRSDDELVSAVWRRGHAGRCCPVAPIAALLAGRQSGRRLTCALAEACCAGSAHLVCPQAARYRLELNQMKAEHAALQMLTHHGEQETVCEPTASWKHLTLALQCAWLSRPPLCCTQGTLAVHAPTGMWHTCLQLISQQTSC